MTILFVMRGVVLLCVLPPFEGWDEYQHLAYASYLVEEGQPPQHGDQSRVPPWMHSALARYPHSELGAAQVGIIGGLTYEQYWVSEPTRSSPSTEATISLYQSQHPPLYYRLIAPIVRRMSPTEDLRSLIGILRAINVLLGAAAVYLVLWALGRLMTEGPHRYLIGLLVGTQPLFLMNCARVASDALAVFLGTAAIVLLLVPMCERKWAGSLAGGAALGLAVLAKTVNLGLAPFACAAAAWKGWQVGQRAWRNAAVSMLLVLTPAVAITSGYFRENIVRYGMLSPMQEAVGNREAGRTWRDAIAEARTIDWPDELGRRYFRRSLWAGAWSFTTIPRWLHHAHAYSLYVAAVGFLFALSRRARVERGLFSQRGTAMLLVMLCASVAAGLTYHMVQSKMFLGMIATNAWYAAVTLPWMLCLACQGLAFYPWRWACRLVGGLLVAIFLVAEWYGVFASMLPLYTQESFGLVSLRRLAEMHPTWLHPVVGGAAVLGGVTTGLLAIFVWIRSERDRCGVRS